MTIFKVILSPLLDKLSRLLEVAYKIFASDYKCKRYKSHLIYQIGTIGISSLTIVLLTAFFIGIVFTLQVAKELNELHSTSLVGSILTLTFLRELCPVLTAVIVTGRIGSAFTADIATMKVTEQLDVLHVLNTHPIHYLIMPRICACVLMMPVLNIFSLATSIASGIITASSLCSISPTIFLASSSISFIGLCLSSVKALVFGFLLSLISCAWGLHTTFGTKSVGASTTSSVVTSLLTIFIVDFVLSYIMFHSS